MSSGGTLKGEMGEGRKSHRRLEKVHGGVGMRQ